MGFSDLQTEKLTRIKGCNLKAFWGYVGTEERPHVPYPHGPRYLLDHEVAPFRHVIQSAHPASVMAAFNEVDGLPCHVNPWILTNVLRGRIGFKGLIIGDYQGIDLVRQYQKIGTSNADAARNGSSGRSPARTSQQLWFSTSCSAY